MRIMTLESDNNIKYWGLNSTDFCELITNQQLITNNLKYIEISLSKSLNRIYTTDYSTHFLSNFNDEKSLFDVKEMRKKDFYKSASKIFSHKNKINNSNEVIKDLFSDSDIDLMISNEIKNDIKILKEVKHIKTIVNLEDDDYQDFNFMEDHRKQLLEENNSNGTEVPKAVTVITVPDLVETICSTIIAFSPFILFLFILPSIIYLADGLDYEMTNSSNILRSLSKADCLKTGERIKPIETQEMKGKKKKNKKHTQPIADASNTKKANLWIFDIVSALIITIFFIIFANLSSTTKSKVDNCIQNYILFMEQRNIIFNLNRDITTALLYAESQNFKNETFMGQQSYTNRVELLIQSVINMQYIKQINIFINSGDKISGINSSILADSIINKIRFEQICSDVITSNVPMDYYKC